jgi:hypothetical protein
MRVRTEEAYGEYLCEFGHEVVDVGTHSTDPVDYPDYAEAAGVALRAGQADRGIVICGSGVGASVAANKLPGIRAGLCHDTYSAHQGVELLRGAEHWWPLFGPVLCLGAADNSYGPVPSHQRGMSETMGLLALGLHWRSHAYRSPPLPSPVAGSCLWNLLLVTSLLPRLRGFRSAASGAKKRFGSRSADGASHPRCVNQ